MIRFLQKLRGLSYVNRWNFHPTIRKENVSEHSFWVAIYAWAISLEACVSPEEIPGIVQQALLHDAEEAVTGDLPALVKRKAGDWEYVERIASEELYTGAPTNIWNKRYGADTPKIVKLADLFAALVYAEEECKMGNKFFFPIRGELIGAICSCVSAGENSDARLSGAVYRLLTGLGFHREERIEMHTEMSHF